MADDARVWVRIGGSWHEGKQVGVKGDRVRVAVPGLARPQLFASADISTQEPRDGESNG